MTRTIAFLAALILGAAFSAASADYSVSDEGLWPESWPKELESLRKQAQTYEGPRVLYRHYLIPFTKQEEFEAAWPHFLKIKTEGAPIVLVRGPKTSFFSVKPAGVHIQTPPVDERPKEGFEISVEDAKNPHGKWRTSATYIELVVDGEIVDLNRIPLPANTLIIDERFKEEKKK